MLVRHKASPQVYAFHNAPDIIFGNQCLDILADVVSMEAKDKVLHKTLSTVILHQKNLESMDRDLLAQLRASLPR